VDRGILFLDEIGDLLLELHPKLLRALQEKQFDRLGGSHTFQVDVRIIAATNQDLRRMVEERKFRADLYYRLNVFPIALSEDTAKPASPADAESGLSKTFVVVGHKTGHNDVLVRAA
jgi:formate hydrogenlyase transcriptional activator